MATDYEAIAQEHRRYYGEGDRHLRIYRRLYDDETHFVYELVQNADDSRSGHLSFVLREGELLVVNNGRRFNEGEKNDVRDICSIGLSEKDLTQIGSFGIGFKAVYAYSDTPEIYSGDERFAIGRLVEPTGINRVRPDIGELLANGETVFRLPFKKGLRSAKVKHLASRLADLHPWTLLFLRHLESVEWKDERTGNRGVYRCSRTPDARVHGAWVVSLTKQVQDAEPAIERFLVHRKDDATLRPPTNIVDELVSQAEDEYELQRIQRSARASQPIEVAFLLDKGRLAPVERSVIFSYLPTAKETQLHFLIQARYQTTPARDNLPKDNNWNRWLVDATAAFLPDVMQSLKESGLILPEFFDVVPVEGDNVPDLLEPIVEAVGQALKTRAFILTDEDAHGTPLEVFSPHSQEFRQLLTGQHLASLNGIPDAKWLHRDIRQGRRFKAVQIAGVREFSPEKLATCFTKDFIEKQSDDWISRFYAFLKGQESLWQRGQYGRPDGILRHKPIIRREDGHHVSPFRGDDPNVYLPPDGDTAFPVVKRALTTEPDALDFLKRLGLSEPAIEDEVVEFILPKYGKDEADLPDAAEHARDMAKIVQALNTSSSTDQRVEAKLKKTPCFRAVHWVSASARYKRAEEIYLPTPELKHYFVGNDDVWFLDESPQPVSPEDFQRVMKKLGVEDKPRRSAFDPKFSPAELRQIRRDAHVTRNSRARVTDHKLEGLEWFLNGLFRMPSDQTASSAKVLWDFLLAYVPSTLPSWVTIPECFQGEYIYQSYGGHPCSFDAHFLKQLREASWLPDQNGCLHKPSEISATELPDSFRRSEVLANALKMTPPEATALARKLGIEPSTIELLQDREKVEQFKKWAALQSRENALTGREAESGTSDDDEPGRATRGGGHRDTSVSGGSAATGGGHTNGGVGGEGTLHEAIKNKIAKEPELLEAGMQLHRRECGLESGYRPDLILQDSQGRFATVEVETAFPGGNDTGVWQAVAYQHVFAAELGVPCHQVRGLLVAPRIPQSIREKCKQLGIEAFEVGEFLLLK